MINCSVIDDSFFIFKIFCITGIANAAVLPVVEVKKAQIIFRLAKKGLENIPIDKKRDFGSLEIGAKNYVKMNYEK